MATRPEDDELTLDTPAEDPENLVDPQEDPENPEPKPEEGDEEEIIFSDDPEQPAENDSALIRHLREELKKTRRELQERPAPEQPKIEVGPRPTLESCEWDEDKHAEALDAWYDRRRQAEQQKTAGEKQAEAANEAFQADVQRFEGARASLKVAGAPEAIETALASLSLVQRAVIVKAADNAATVLAALGKHPARLTELAAIEDPIKLATAIVKLEGKIQMTKRKAPEPEEVATGNASVRQGADAQLEKLEKEAARTGDRSSLIAYKRNLKGRAKA
jgi:hypothetical protein